MKRVVKPTHPEATASFFINDFKEGTLGGTTGIFLTVDVLKELGRVTDEIRNYALPRIMALQNKAGGFGAYENIDVEVPSELQETYRAVTVLKIIGAEFNKQKVSRFVFRMLNPDGGYGGNGHSTLASTYYATEIHKLLGAETEKLNITRNYLRKRLDNWQVQFIEDLYWLVGGLVNMGEKTNYPDKISRFIRACQRSNGGFSRATIMGIPTLEYTYYALSILKKIGSFIPEQER